MITREEATFDHENVNHHYRGYPLGACERLKGFAKAPAKTLSKALGVQVLGVKIDGNEVQAYAHEELPELRGE